MEASLRGISCSESDICLRMLGRVSGRENCAWRKAEEAETENAVMVQAFGPQAKQVNFAKPSTNPVLFRDRPPLSFLSFSTRSSKMKLITGVAALALAAMANAATYTVCQMRDGNGRFSLWFILSFSCAR